MNRKALRQMPRKGSEKVAEVAGRAVNEELKGFSGWIRRRHWAWLWASVGASWVLDVVVNTFFHSLTVFGHLIDSFLGPIDEAFIALVPIIAIKELWRRAWSQPEPVETVETDEGDNT